MKEKIDDHGMLEGISALHSWIKSQTMIKPYGKETKKSTGVSSMVYQAALSTVDYEVITPKKFLFEYAYGPRV